MAEFLDILKRIIELGLPFAAILLSIASLAIAIRNWRQSNRPIVAAFVRTCAGGNVGMNFELVVLNAGSRPAAEVSLSCLPKELEACLITPDAKVKEEVLWRNAVACFAEEGLIPLLLPGAEAVSSFGRTGEGGLWKYRSYLPAIIKYRDLEGRKYSSKIRLIIKDSSTFSGGKWSQSK
jgi:hypothetical protein